MKDYERYIAAGLFAVSILGALFLTGNIPLEIVSGCVNCHAMKMQYQDMVYDYTATFTSNCQAPTGVGSSGSTGFAIFYTAPGMELQSAYIDKIVTADPWGCMYCGQLSNYTAISGTYTGRDNDISPDADITYWGFYLPSQQDSGSDAMTCSYTYHVAFVPIPVEEYCGDEVCQATESHETCAADCPPPAYICGNNVCETGETSANCPTDCPPPTICGNGVCESGETSANCPTDCPQPSTDYTLQIILLGALVTIAIGGIIAIKKLK